HAVPYSQHSSKEGDHHRLGEKLAHDVALPGADGAADSDLTGALEHGRQHDVHNPDTADQQRDAGDTDHDERENLVGGLLLLQQTGGDQHGEVSRVFVRGGEDGANHTFRLDRIGSGLNPDVEAVNLVLEPAHVVVEAPHDGVERSDYHVVAVTRRRALRIVGSTLRRHDADHLQPGVVQLDVLANGVVETEQIDCGS